MNIQLSKQDLQEYLDDGYTAADIAKDFSVSPAVITEKIRKFGVKKKKQTKLVKKRGRPTSPKKQKRLKPPKIQSTPRKGKANLTAESTPSKKDLQNVITEVIQDNPEEAVDHIHDLLSFMGFDLEKSVVEDRIKKLKASSETAIKKEQKSPQQDEKSKQSCENDQQINKILGSDEDKDASKASVSEGVDTEEQTDLSLQGQLAGGIKEDYKEDASTSQDGKIVENFDAENEPSVQEQIKGRPLRPRKINSKEFPRTEPVKRRGPGRPRKLQSSEKSETEPKRELRRPKKPLKIALSKGRKSGRPRKTCSNEASQEESGKRPRRDKSSKVNVGDTDVDDGLDEDSAVEDGVSDKEWSEAKKPKKRGRKPGQKRKAEKIQNGPPVKRGRPCLNLSPDNLKLCVENGLPVGEIAHALGACRQSINRYLQVYKMRKKDRFSNLSDDELDQVVSDMCRNHPEWGQVRIQEELKKKGLHFRRIQVRNSVRRVDPVGIELRKLKNLKMRWNRGSLNRLDKILPADGINMTSTESFISRPPRNGLNALNEEDSVRLLKSIVTTHKKSYVTPITSKMMVKQTQNETPEESTDNKEDQSVLKDEPKEDFQEGLVEAAQEVEGKMDILREVSQEKSDEENVEPNSNRQQDLRKDAPSLSGSEDDKEHAYRQMLYNMVMSTNQKSDRTVSTPTEDSEVNIPKEELEKCVEDGFSSSRIADKFGTTIKNVRRHLTMYKLTMSTRFEKISEEKIDEIVRDAIQEFSIQKGSEVYGYVRKKGFRIRKVDIHKSVSKLYPRGLHRKGSSILKQSWDAVSEPHPSDEGSSGTQERGQENEMENGRASETVVMLNSEELVQLMNGEGSITLVQQEGSPSKGNEGVFVSEEQVSNSIASALVTAGDVQQTVKPQGDEISAIIVEIDLPGDGGNVVNDQVVDQVEAPGVNQIVQYHGTQQSSDDVVLVVSDEGVTRENINDIVAVNTIPSENEAGGVGLNI